MKKLIRVKEKATNMRLIKRDSPFAGGQARRTAFGGRKMELAECVSRI